MWTATSRMSGRGPCLIVDILTFCVDCGSPLPHGPPVICQACGSSHWLNAKPAAGALVTRGEELLLVRRAHPPWQGQWCVPSGFCEHLEHPISTAERETLEETGIEVEVVGYLGTWMNYYAENDGLGDLSRDDVLIVASYYHARPVVERAGAFDLAEIADARWFQWDEIPQDLAPPTEFPPVLAAWRAALLAGEAVTPLRDRATLDRTSVSKPG